MPCNAVHRDWVWSNSLQRQCSVDKRIEPVKTIILVSYMMNTTVSMSNSAIPFSSVDGYVTAVCDDLLMVGMCHKSESEVTKVKSKQKIWPARQPNILLQATYWY